MHFDRSENALNAADGCTGGCCGTDVRRSIDSTSWQLDQTDSDLSHGVKHAGTTNEYEGLLVMLIELGDPGGGTNAHVCLGGMRTCAGEVGSLAAA